MKKFAEEVVKYFWIPVIMAVVSYIFFQLKDVVLGIIVLVALSAVYTLVRLYFMHKKWWLIIILVVVVFGSVGVYFLRTPDITLTINGEDVTGTSISTAAGTITINPAPQNGLYNKGAVVTLHASPSGGYDFGGWTGTDDDGVNPTMVTMNSNKDVKANFVSRFLLIINNEQVIGSFVSFPEGSVSIDPAPDSDGKYASGTTVKLTVDANTGYDWTGWSGTRDDKANPTTVIMSGGNKQVTILFEGRFALTVSNQLVIGSAVGFPEGSVTVSPAPGDDGKYAYGTRVTLTASAEPGYGWKSWTGTSGDTANPTMVTINSDKHIAINWEFRYLATINNEAISGSSMNLTGGTVAIDPAPGADGAYSKNTKVTFTATATAGYRFDRWGGDVSGTANAVTLTLNSDKNLTAIFIRLYNLTAVTSPGAGGAVSPGSGTYDEGANVTITVTPAEGYRFDRWGGDASGNVTSTTITMNADKSVTAIFIKLYTLTITVSPPEGGVVSTANGTYDEGASVTITATAAEGYVFDHWEGDVTGTDATVTITMDGNKNLTAIFVPSP
ncbi:MAG: hypothetical protein A2Z15_06665 [Chloroflexi bacterium RBG_16_50_11]|nr:MAG: hypothetical protein A2Z15_06665 [Chloroflexi bacterium RBG_16_50_11]